MSAYLHELPGAGDQLPSENEWILLVMIFFQFRFTPA